MKIDDADAEKSSLRQFQRETGRAKDAPRSVLGIPYLRLKAQVRIQMRAFQYLALDRLVHQKMEGSLRKVRGLTLESRSM